MKRRQAACCSRITVRLALLSYFAATLLLASAQENGLEGKELPGKGDRECPSLKERQDVLLEGGDPSIWLNPCLVDDEGPSAEIPDNGIVLQLFASLPAFGSDSGALLMWVVAGYLDEASFEYDVRLNSTFDFFNSTDRRPHAKFQAEVVLQHVVTENIEKKDASWWWRYQLIFHCFWGNDSASNVNNDVGPLVSERALQKIKQDLNFYLRQGLDSISVFQFNERSHGVLGLAMEDPRESETPFVDGPPTAAPSFSPTEVPIGSLTDSPTALDRDSSDPALDEATYTVPINPQLWDWRRYLGLSLFLGTFAGTVLLTQIAATRQRRRTRKQVWGNLGSEEGVDALLNTGWNIKGSKMEIYDKKGWGYRDDDSMLIGGFEQKHIVGAEITVTQDSDTTDTNHLTATTDANPPLS